ncbi:MAG: hypothetical protein Q8L72_05985 [Moraxellaceae bacterium]|nr:hypothetical protein [Moraxellaceae bacterium]
MQDFINRGLVKDPDQSLAQLFDERLPLYKKYADITVQGAGLNADEVCALIKAQYQLHQQRIGNVDKEGAQ